jgi:hypothetical protein
MPDPTFNFQDTALTLLAMTQRTVKRATEGLTEEQLFYQPSPDSNSIGWLAWHLSRWKDRYVAMVTERPHVWVSQGWHQRFGMDPEGTGFGDTPEQVRAFRVGRELLFGYVDAAHQATVDFVKEVTLEQWEKPYQYMPTMKPITTWQGFVAVSLDFTQHTGQIAYLRGLITGRGWMG